MGALSSCENDITQVTLDVICCVALFVRVVGSMARAAGAQSGKEGADSSVAKLLACFVSFVYFNVSLIVRVLGVVFAACVICVCMCFCV